VAKITAKKLKRVRRKKKSWQEEFVAEFWPNLAEKGPKKFFERISFLAELFSFTGQKIILGPGNAGSSILYTRQKLSAVRFINQIRKDDLCLPF
jgi:hypothetical protein